VKALVVRIRVVDRVSQNAVRRVGRDVHRLLLPVDGIGRRFDRIGTVRIERVTGGGSADGEVILTRPFAAGIPPDFDAACFFRARERVVLAGRFVLTLERLDAL